MCLCDLRETRTSLARVCSIIGDEVVSIIVLSHPLTSSSTFRDRRWSKSSQRGNILLRSQSNFSMPHAIRRKSIEKRFIVFLTQSFVRSMNDWSLRKLQQQRKFETVTFLGHLSSLERRCAYGWEKLRVYLWKGTNSEAHLFPRLSTLSKKQRHTEVTNRQAFIDIKMWKCKSTLLWMMWRC